MYYPLAYYTGPSKEIDPGEENRQAAVVALIRTGFLKRFESSVEAFRASCERLLVKLLGWIVVHAETSEEKQTLADWRQTHIKLIEQVRDNQPHLFGTENGEPDDEADEDLLEEECVGIDRPISIEKTTTSLACSPKRSMISISSSSSSPSSTSSTTATMTS